MMGHVAERPRRNQVLRRCGSVLALVGVAAGVLLAAAAGAAAHVTVGAPGATVGSSDAVITFRVPNEEANASTVGLTLALPTDTPLIGVKPADQPGWNAKTTLTKLAKPIKTDDGEIDTVVTRVDWTARSGAGIRPTYFGEFTIIAAQLPEDARKITFKAIQAYSNGKKTAWIQVAAPGSTAEPDDPAPVLTLAPAPATGAAAGSDVTQSPSSAGDTTRTPSASSNGTSATSVTALIVGSAAFVLAVAALVITVRRRRDPSANTD